ncbi:MAG TPA: head GIN domain-containing protein [Saprospiraceae bacterium]|nr:head GIN domain-containing protein [Saprospiraceae bacterium]HNL38656.1 head GIN domain-containing protein [Saprospiraceae bacterium]HNM26343.1 head GIN domain-containing protein [Saprospiraceae bacterium]
MRNLLLFMLLVAIFVVGKRGCSWHWNIFSNVRGEGPVQTETRTVEGFHGVDLSLAGTVEATVSDQYSVEVSAQGNLLPHLKTEVNDGILKVYFDDNVSSSESVTIRVSAPAYDAFTLSGSGKIALNSPLKNERLDLDISGSGDLILPQIDIRETNIDIAGSGTVEIGGTGNKVDAQVSGSGDVRASNFTVAICHAEVTGSGTLRCDVSQELDASVSGSGNVYYTGNPGVKENVSGSGEIKKVN